MLSLMSLLTHIRLPFFSTISSLFSEMSLLKTRAVERPTREREIAPNVAKLRSRIHTSRE
jgi:hypothetical protein